MRWYSLEYPNTIDVRKNDSGDYVVYEPGGKIRYEGNDEACVVNEIYTEIKGHAKKNIGISLICVAAIAVIIAIIVICSSLPHSHDGYYSFEGSTYYKYEDIWYLYDPSSPNSEFGGGWIKIKDNETTDAIESDYKSYFVSKDYNGNIEASNWKDLLNNGYYRSTIKR